MILYEEVSVLVFTVSIIYFLLQALDWLLVRPFVDGHDIARVRHAVIPWLPRAGTLGRDLIKVILCHASYFHRGQGMILFISRVI